MRFEDAGRRYVIAVGSDTERDGMYAQLRTETGTALAEVFHFDPGGPMTVQLFADSVQFGALERLLDHAKRRLPPR